MCLQVIGCPLIPDMAMHAAQEEGYGPSARTQARAPGPGERHDPFKDLTRAPADFSSEPRQAAVVGSGGRDGRLRRPVQVERGEQVHQDRLSKFGDRLRDMEDMANSIGLELSTSRGVMGTLETQEKRWEEQERARMERGNAAVDQLLAEAQSSQAESERLAEEAEHLLIDIDLDETGDGR